MRKIFSIFAAAIIALSFASCEKADPGIKFFRMKVTNITDTSAVLSINPADTSAYYCADFQRAAVIDQYNLDSILVWDQQYMQDYIDDGYTFEQFANEYLWKGATGPDTLTWLSPNTEYIFWAYEVRYENEKVTLGHIAVKRFTTKTIPVVKTVDLGTLEIGYLEDYSQYGAYLICSWNEAETTEIVLGIYDEDFKGSYDFSDIEPGVSHVITEEEGGTYLADAKFTTTFNESEKTGKATGWVVGENGIKYKFTAKYSSEPGHAPRRVAVAPKTDITKGRAYKGFQPKKNLFK